MSKTKRPVRTAQRMGAAERVEIRRTDEAMAGAGATIARQATAMAAQEATLTSMRREIRDKDALLALVLESSVDGVLVFRSVVDGGDEIVDFECLLHNPAAERLYGLDDLQGQRLLRLHPDMSHLAMWASLKRVAVAGEPYEGEYRYERGGQPSWFRVLAVRVEGGLAITFSDITSLKELELTLRRRIDELARANQAKAEFLGVVSHELRTPINIVMGFLGIVEDELVGPVNEAQHDCLRKAAGSSERLLLLINDLIDMRRIEAGELDLAPRTTAFAPIVADVLANLAAAGARHVLVNDVPRPFTSIQADPVRTAQVLTILVGNAIKFTPPGGTIVVSARLRGGVMRCEVRDTGIGVADRDLRKLFRTFSQVDMSSTRTVGGAGLGLRIAKHLVETLGGHIGVKSRPGEGTTFWFTMPAAAGAA